MINLDRRPPTISSLSRNSVTRMEMYLKCYFPNKINTSADDDAIEIKELDGMLEVGKRSRSTSETSSPKKRATLIIQIANV